MRYDHHTKLPPAAMPQLGDWYDLAHEHTVAMAAMDSFVPQMAYLREQVRDADVIVTLGKPPPGSRFGDMIVSIVRGAGYLNGRVPLPRKPLRVYPAVTLDNVTTALWHLACGELDVSREARRALRKEDAGAPDRLLGWVTVDMLSLARQLGRDIRANPDMPDISPEIRAAVRYAEAWEAELEAFHSSAS